MKVLRMVLGPIQANCYIVYDDNTKEAFVVDPGDEGGKVAEVLKERHLKLRYILLTHAHADHIGGVEELASLYPDAKIAIHLDDEDLLENPTLNMTAQLCGRPISLKADLYLNDGDEIDFNGSQIEIIHTPGHTKGGVCYYFDNLLFTGDTLFRDSIGRSDFYGGDYETLISSIVNKLMVLPGDVPIYPGHMEPSTIGREKKMNMFIKSYFK